MATLRLVRKRAESGQAIIEFALTLPLLLLIIMGVFDFGFMFQRYEVVTNAAREGARVSVLPGYAPADGVNRALSYMTSAGLGGGSITTRTPPCGGSKVPNSRCAAVTASTETLPPVGAAAAKTVNTVVVTVEFDHEHVFVGPFAALFGGGPLGTTRLAATSTMRAEQ